MGCSDRVQLCRRSSCSYLAGAELGRARRRKRRARRTPPTARGLAGKQPCAQLRRRQAKQLQLQPPVRPGNLLLLSCSGGKGGGLGERLLQARAEEAGEVHGDGEGGGDEVGWTLLLSQVKPLTFLQSEELRHNCFSGSDET